MGDPGRPPGQMETQLSQLAIQLSPAARPIAVRKLGESVNVEPHPGRVGLGEGEEPVVNPWFELNLAPT